MNFPSIPLGVLSKAGVGNIRTNAIDIQLFSWLKLRGLSQIMFLCFLVLLYIITLVNTHMSQHTTLVNLLQGGGEGEGEGEGRREKGEGRGRGER